MKTQQFSLITLIVTILFCTITIVNGNQVTPSPTDPNECAIAFNQTAALIEPALLVGKKTFPVTIEEINQHCELANQVYKNVRRYGKCLTGLPAQTVTIFLRGMKKFIQSICLSAMKKNETIDILKCASNETIPNWNMCLNLANRKLDLLASNTSDPAMVGNICCTYSSLLDCVSTSTSSVPGCIKPGSQNITTFLTSSLDLVVKDVTELLCGDYETKQSCDTHNAQRADKIASAANSQHMVKGAFLLSPLIKATQQLAPLEIGTVTDEN